MSYLTVKFIQEQMYLLQQGDTTEEVVIQKIEAEVFRKRNEAIEEYDAERFSGDYDDGDTTDVASEMAALDAEYSGKEKVAKDKSKARNTLLKSLNPVIKNYMQEK